MTQETMEWLNTMTLIGFTSKRGEAWHYQATLQGDEPNHYEEAIPIEDVQRRLFDWEAIPEQVYVLRSGIPVAIPNKQAISASDTGDVLGIFSDGYQPHQYKEWLLDNVANILDDGLAVGSAGLLRNRGQAWVSVEVPENIKTPEGVEFRPNLIAATSFDGTLATTYKRAVTNVVCDNTLAAGLSENGQRYKLKHTRYSNLRIDDARHALEIVYSIADDFAAEVARLAAWEVSSPQFGMHLDIMVPLTDAQGVPIKGRGLTLAENKRDSILSLYNHDDRVAPWAGTALGVLQAYNTYAHHFMTVRGQSRVQRNREYAITGKMAQMDHDTLVALATVTQKELVSV